MPFRLSIHNLMGIWNADLSVEGVTLIAGPNGAGKTSVLEAAASAMSAHHHVGRHWGLGTLRNPKLKGGGGVEVSYSNWSRCIMWPDAEVTEKGSPPRLSPVTTGAVPFFSLSEAARIAEVGKRVRMDPSPDDVQRALVGFAGVDPTTGPQILAAALEHGWDALHAEAKERLDAEHAAWKEMTGQDYTREGAAAWHPPGINPTLSYRLADFDLDVASIERRLLDREALEKIGRADIDKLAAAAGRLPDAQRRLNEATKAHAAAEQKVKAFEERLFEYEGRGGEVRQASCPCCGEPIAVALMRGKHQTWHLRDRPKTAGRNSPILADRTRKSLAKAQRRLTAAAAEMEAAQLDRDRCIDADTALRAMSRPDDDDDRTVDQLLEALQAARGRRDDFQRWLRAKETRRAIASSFVLERALSPRGIRKRLMDTALLELNRKLVDLCDQADLPKVVITGAGGCMVGGKPYHQAPESGRWAAEVMVRIAFALIEGSSFTTIPSLHTLQPTGRPPFFRMLKATGLDVLVELTPKDRASVPDLHRARLGQAYWIAGGNVEAL